MAYVVHRRGRKPSGISYQGAATASAGVKVKARYAVRREAELVAELLSLYRPVPGFVASQIPDTTPLAHVEVDAI